MKDNAYYPSLRNVGKYQLYMSYFWEYTKYADWNSIKASFGYMLFKKPPSKSWTSQSRLGRFHLRQGTNDFQFINYAYEKKIHDFVAENAKSLDVFIDVGACIGEYCVWMASQQVKCIAFEPVNHEACSTNFALNKVQDRIALYKCGLGGKEEIVTFDVKKVVTSSSHISRDGSGANKIQISTLDNIMKDTPLNISDRILMKLDIEGMELEMLEGAREFITRHPNISIIYEHTFSGNDEIIQKLRQFGQFEFRFLDEVNILAQKTGPSAS